MSKLQELKEGVEHATHDPRLVPVSFTMALLAVLVAVVTLLGHRAHTAELLVQTQAADVWAEYQAKNIRGNMHELMAGMLDSAAPANEKTAKLKADWQQRADKLNADKGPLLAEARKLEAESQHERYRGDRFDLSEALLEMALVVTSITLLTKNRLFWWGGLVLGVAGLVVAIPVLR